MSATRPPGRDRTDHEPPGGGRFKGLSVGKSHQARLHRLVGFRDRTLGTDMANEPGDYQSPRTGERPPSQNFQPYKGVSRKATPERTDDEEST